MDPLHGCPATEDLLMFVDEALAAPERATVAAHVERCQTCREYVAYVRGLGALLREAREVVSPAEPCPDSLTLVRYNDGMLDQDTAQHIRAHLLFCDACFTEMLALEQADDAAGVFGVELEQYIVRRRTEQPALPLAAARTEQLQVPAQVSGPPGAIERLVLMVLYGPSLSPEGHFSLDVRLPDGQQLEGRAVVVKLRFDSRVFEVHGRVERNTITIDHTFQGGYNGTASPQEMRQALLDVLEVWIL
jgi:anti-sigma factor RsiW